MEGIVCSGVACCTIHTHLIAELLLQFKTNVLILTAKVFAIFRFLLISMGRSVHRVAAKRVAISGYMPEATVNRATLFIAFHNNINLEIRGL